jgi:molybdenum cofactor cytidylyltransferase
MDERPYSAVILAAGRSRRMGRSKPLLPWGRSTLLTAWLTRLAEMGYGPIAVVVGDDGELIQAAVASELPPACDVVWVRNPNPDGTGPRESLLLGLDALPADRPAWFTPVDVPVADAAMLQDIADAWQIALAERAVEPLAAVPTFEGTPGHPVLAGRAFVAMLFEGEAGDRIDELLQWATRRLVRVPVEQARVLADMNFPEDYRGEAPTGDFGGGPEASGLDLAGTTLPPDP